MICYWHILNRWEFPVEKVPDSKTVLAKEAVGVDAKDTKIREISAEKVSTLDTKKIPTNVSNTTYLRYSSTARDGVVVVTDVVIEQDPPEERIVGERELTEMVIR